MWTDLAPSDYQVCFGDVADYTTPICEMATVTTAVDRRLCGRLWGASPSGFGCLRVTTSLALPSQILVDGGPNDSRSLNWVKVVPGDYTVSFADVSGFTTPAPQRLGH